MRTRSPIALFLLALAGASPAAAQTAPAQSNVNRLKLCSWLTVNDTVPTLNVKLAVAGRGNAKGTFTFTAPGVRQTRRFTIRSVGVALTSFAVTSPGNATIAVKLATSPPRYRMLHLTLPASVDVTPRAGCVPH